MKKIYLILFIFLTIKTVTADVQQAQIVHQYIVQQAYQYLISYLGRDIPEMRDHLGTWEQGSVPFIEGKIVTGAYREDVEDVVYGNGYPNTSSTHFWNPDDGDGSHFCNIINQCFPNAYEKALKYINGGWEVVGSTDWLFYYNGVKARLINMATGQSIRGFYYDNLGNLYSDRNIKIYVASGRYIIDCESGSDFIMTPKNGVINLQLNNDEKDKIVWEILGRIAHLLADVSTPAHALNDEHDITSTTDPYENTMSSLCNAYNYNNAINQAQQWGQINITHVSNPIKYLFYTSAQIAGHFPSYDVDGNNSWGINESFSNYPPLQTIIN